MEVEPQVNEARSVATLSKWLEKLPLSKGDSWLSMFIFTPFSPTSNMSAANAYQHCNHQTGRWNGEAHHASEDHGSAQYAQLVCHGHHVLHEPALQVRRGLKLRSEDRTYSVFANGMKAFVWNWAVS